MAAELRRFYRGFIMLASEEHRWALYQYIKGFVENTSFVSTSACLPFICDDNSLQIVSTAVIDYVSLGRILDGDPMTHVKGIIELIEGSALRSEGAAFGGLLSLGDRRVCKLLLPLRDGLARRAVDDVAKSNTGLMSAATVDFYLDWLEAIGGSNDDLYGAVASGLVLHRRVRLVDLVTTGERPFPITALTPEVWNAISKPIPLAEYTQRIAPRLYALERSEAPPRIMRFVLTEWGLEPRSDPSEAARLPTLQ
jgi:hypothetical protein